jgi:hypothetical protein
VKFSHIYELLSHGEFAHARPVSVPHIFDDRYADLFDGALSVIRDIAEIDCRRVSGDPRQ